jgi:hypothetical protein
VEGRVVVEGAVGPLRIVVDVVRGVDDQAARMRAKSRRTRICIQGLDEYSLNASAEE